MLSFVNSAFRSVFTPRSREASRFEKLTDAVAQAHDSRNRWELDQLESRLFSDQSLLEAVQARQSARFGLGRSMLACGLGTLLALNANFATADTASDEDQSASSTGADSDSTSMLEEIERWLRETFTTSSGDSGHGDPCREGDSC